jgi:hypothetical protein
VSVTLGKDFEESARILRDWIKGTLPIMSIASKEDCRFYDTERLHEEWLREQVWPGISHLAFLVEVFQTCADRVIRNKQSENASGTKKAIRQLRTYLRHLTEELDRQKAIIDEVEQWDRHDLMARVGIPGESV